MPGDQDQKDCVSRLFSCWGCRCGCCRRCQKAQRQRSAAGGKMNPAYVWAAGLLRADCEATLASKVIAMCCLQREAQKPALRSLQDTAHGRIQRSSASCGSCLYIKPGKVARGEGEVEGESSSISVCHSFCHSISLAKAEREAFDARSREAASCQASPQGSETPGQN